MSLEATVAFAALAEAGLDLDAVDGLFTIPIPVMTVAEYLGARVVVLDSTSIGGASFEAHLNHASALISTGRCDVALIVYASLQRSRRARTMSAQGDITSQYEAPYGILFPSGSYALAASRYLYQYGLDRGALSSVAVAARKWAALNPAATTRELITYGDVEASGLVSDPLTRLDCCLVTDGAAAVVVTSEEHARALGVARGVYVRGCAEHSTHNIISQMPDLVTSAAHISGPTALRRADMTLDDIDLLMIYDSFTITVLITLESLGIAPPGEAARMVESGRFDPGGELPMNTSGGGLAFCHPGAYGLMLIVEAVRQLRGDCGERQVPDASVALVNATGGTLSSTATCILSAG
jgi:acetyl-CoA acetyltransferase